MIKRLVYIIFILFFNLLFPQSIQGIKIPDSLKNKKFQYLQNRLQKNINLDNLNAEFYANLILLKAKKEKKQAFIFDGYYAVAQVAALNRKNGYPFADTLIAITKGVNNSVYPARAHIIKGILLNNDGRYRDALEHYVIAKKLAEGKNEDQLIIIQKLIAILKNSSGDHQEALDLFRSNYDFQKKRFLKGEINTDIYISSILSLANGYAKNKDYLNSKKLVEEGITLSKKYKSQSNIIYLLMISGIDDYYLGHHYSSQHTLSKIEEKLIDIRDFENLAILYYYLGQNKIALGKATSAISYFQKSDSLGIKYNVFDPVRRDGYEFLITHYKNLNDSKNELLYTQKLLHFDSAIANSRSGLSAKITKKYDVPVIVEAKNKTISDLSWKNFLLIFSLILAVLLIAGIGLLFFRSRKKQQLYKLKAENLINELNREPAGTSVFESNNVNDTQVSERPNILNDQKFLILKSKIENFESSKSFLRRNITLELLSKEFDTNRDYLSKFINEYKKKNFSQYLNDLRINFIIKELKGNKEIRKYTIAAIANDSGFNNTESFTNAFKKISGTLPSVYIKTLNNESL